MERTEELVHNLFVAQNELIAHLANLKAVPNLAAVLFGTPEKNSTTEKNNPIKKNSTPEKNSSEVEKIRQEWMDDVVGLASEFFINEESFNVKNLSDLMINTACALDALLNLKSSVNQTEKKITKPTFHQWQTKKLSIEKQLTCREKAKQEHPDAVGENFCGGVYLCPHDYGYSNVRYCSFRCNRYTVDAELCTACWDQLCNP